jgi:hypothetical protein
MLVSPMTVGASSKSKFLRWQSDLQTVLIKYHENYGKDEKDVDENNVDDLKKTCLSYQALSSELQLAPRTGDSTLNSLTAKAVSLLYSIGDDCFEFVATPTAITAQTLGGDFKTFAALANQLTSKSKVISRKY